MAGCASLDAWRAAILTRLTDPCLFDFYCTLDRAPNYAELIGQARASDISNPIPNPNPSPNPNPKPDPNPNQVHGRGALCRVASR